MMHQIERKSIGAACPAIQRANQTLQAAETHFARVAYCKRFDAIDDTLEPFDISHDAIDMKKCSIELYRAAYRLSETKKKHPVDSIENEFLINQNIDLFNLQTKSNTINTKIVWYYDTVFFSGANCATVKTGFFLSRQNWLITIVVYRVFKWASFHQTITQINRCGF